VWTCFINFNNCASPLEIQTAKDRFLVKEYLSASLYGDLFPTLLACPPTLELLASSRYDMNNTAIRSCNGVASLRSQMDCTRILIPKMVEKQREVPLSTSSPLGIASADPVKLGEFRNLLCEAASNITSGNCGFGTSVGIDTVASNLDPNGRAITQCWNHDEVNVAVPTESSAMVEFFGQTLIYNLNRLITQRGGSENSATSTVDPITPDCLRPSDRSIIDETILPLMSEMSSTASPRKFGITHLLTLTISVVINCVSRNNW